MVLSLFEKVNMENIILLEGEIMEFISNNSPIVSVTLNNGKVYDCVHITMVEIFSSSHYPVGQNIGDNTKVLLEYFNKNCLSETDFIKNMNTLGFVLGLVGSNFDGENLNYIWNGFSEAPWKIGKPNITPEVLRITRTTKLSLNKIIDSIKYAPLF